jgi:hypothetical protein
MSRTTPHSPDIPSQLALLLHIGLFRCRYLSHAFSRSVSIVDVPAVSHTHRYDITDHPRPTMSLKSSTSNSSPRQGWPLHITLFYVVDPITPSLHMSLSRRRSSNERGTHMVSCYVNIFKLRKTFRGTIIGDRQHHFICSPSLEQHMHESYDRTCSRMKSARRPVFC